MSFLPCYIPGTGNGISTMCVVPPDAPVYSDYTGNLVGYGPIPFGILSDAPVGHKNYGKNYHGIIVNGAGEYRMHSPFAHPH
jgi:hypothetical protein